MDEINVIIGPNVWGPRRGKKRFLDNLSSLPSDLRSCLFPPSSPEGHRSIPVLFPPLPLFTKEESVWNRINYQFTI